MIAESGSVVFHSAGIHDLPALAEHIAAACRRADANEADAFAIRLAVEEVFTNIVSHGYGRRPGPVRVEVRQEGRSLLVTLQDEAPPFDPVNAPTPQLTAAAEEREPGGLGWHLVRQMMDEVRHRSAEGGGNVLTLVKKLS